MDTNPVTAAFDTLVPTQQVNPDEGPPAVQAPIDVRSAALALLAALAAVFILRWASALFIPLVLGGMLYYALSPTVEAMARAHVPRALGAAVLILTVLGAGAAGLYSLLDDANKMIEALPAAAEKVQRTLRARHTPAAPTALASVQKAADELARAAEPSPSRPPPGTRRVQLEKAGFNVRDHLWSGTRGLLTLVGQFTLVTFLTYFLLLSGDSFRRKLVKITGPTLAKKKITVQALDEINAQIHRYLMVQLWSSVGVGVVTGTAFYLIGMPHALAWGVATGILNLIPYIGSIAVSVAAIAVAFVQFETNTALLVAGVCLVIQTIQGNLLVPWLTSRAGRMNPVAVFVGVLAWGWLWGVWGMLLGIPVMMVIKSVCDRVDGLKPFGELLGT